MFSPTQHQDKKFLMEVAELIELLVKLKTTQSLDLAESFGDYYLELENKIKTYDYTQDDEYYYHLDYYIKQ
jgi:ribosomal 30S subunit maturation factor RimM